MNVRRMFGCSLFVIQITLTICSPSVAQLKLGQLEHKSWGVNEGAPANCISIAEDGRGLLWITSPSGTYTFNGQTFRPFAFAREIDSANTFLYFLSAAPNGTIWGASRIRGILRIDARRRVTSYGEKEGLPALAATSLVARPNDEVWAVIGGDLYHLAPQGRRWYDETPASGLPAGEVTAMIFDSEGKQWIGTKRGIYYRKSDKISFEQTRDRWASGWQPELLTEDSKTHKVWFSLFRSAPLTAVFQQVQMANRGSGKPLSFTLKHEIIDAKFDGSGSVWFSDIHSGLYRASLSDAVTSKGLGSRIEHVGAAQGLSSDSTRFFLQDNQGDLWISTMKGIDRFRRPDLTRAIQPSISGSAFPDLALGTASSVWLGSGGDLLYNVVGGSVRASGVKTVSVLFFFKIAMTTSGSTQGKALQGGRVED